MESQVELARIADELLEHTRTLRREHEELRDRLAGIGPKRAAEAAPAERRVSTNGFPTREPQGDFYPMVLQMALAGEPREAALDQLHVLEYQEADELVDEVYARVESQRPRRRRLFTRRG
jgi:hypothetical protein